VLYASRRRLSLVAWSSWWPRWRSASSAAASMTSRRSSRPFSTFPEVRLSDRRRHRHRHHYQDHSVKRRRLRPRNLSAGPSLCCNHVVPRWSHQLHCVAISTQQRQQRARWQAVMSCELQTANSLCGAKRGQVVLLAATTYYNIQELIRRWYSESELWRSAPRKLPNSLK